MLLRTYNGDYQIRLVKDLEHWDSDETCYKVFRTFNGIENFIGTVYSRTVTSSKIKNSPFRKNIVGYKEWIPSVNGSQIGLSLTRKSAIEDLIMNQ